MSSPVPSTTPRRRSGRFRVAAAGVALAAVAGLVAACSPSPAGPGGRYLDPVPGTNPQVTPADQPVLWGAAPYIDPHYGGTLYAGTALEQPDPRPALDEDGNEPLRMWVADPADGRTDRPAIVWLHGGGFALGINSMYGLATRSGVEYAKRGYVGFSVEYRTNTTLVGSGQRPPSLCQWVQDNVNPNDPVWVERSETCAANIQAATRDALAAVRYLRANAAQFGIDPDRIAVGGFSAGAVTAVGTAYRADDTGSVSYFPGDDPAADSRPQAVFGASGCLTPVDATLTTPGIDPGDAPISLIASRNDQAVDYECSRDTVLAARAQQLVAEMTSYCDSGLHASKLYEAHKAATDEQWTTFLARWLNLRDDVRGPSAAAVCPN